MVGGKRLEAMDIRSASVLLGLNVTNQSNALLAIFSRSKFTRRSYAAEIGFQQL